MERARERPINHDFSLVRIKTKIQRTVVDMKIWGKALFSDAKLQFQLASEVVMRLDVAQEKRALTLSEFQLGKAL